MNIIIACITLIILVLLIIRQIQIWKVRVLISPAFYFAGIWSLGTLSLFIFTAAGVQVDTYPQYMNELNIYIAFTGLCFLYFTKKSRDKIQDNSIIDFNFMPSLALYKWLCMFVAIAAIIEFIKLGGNLNMGYAREHVHEIQENRSTLTSYATVLSNVLSIWAGHKLIKELSYSVKNKWYRLVWLFVPLIANLIMSINVGGRVDIFFSFMCYLIGIGLALPININLNKFRKPILAISIVAISIMGFISFVSKQRANYYNDYNVARIYIENNYPLLSPLYGAIEYCNAQYKGYEYRRVDAVDLNNLGYGRYTFNGFINWTLPFSSQIGLNDVSIAKICGIYYNNQETYDFQREYYQSTHSCYLTMVKDFGVYGAFFCIFFLVFISHQLFIKIQQRKNINKACSLFLFYIFLSYWQHSNFYGTLSSTILIPLYGFLIIDLFKIKIKC